MKARHKRLVFVAAAVVAVGIAAVLVLNALQSNIAYFFSPTQVIGNEAPVDRAFRIGGLVEEGSVQRRDDGLTVQFVVTDTAKSVKVSYTGILPDLFNEGQGVVAKGKLGEDGVFYAEEVLAKHDESYMPPEVESAIKEAQKAGATIVNPHDK